MAHSKNGRLSNSPIPRMSDEQLYGLLNSSYSFKDTSLLSRFLFRPYWKVMSSGCNVDVPPTCLLTLSLFLSILNVVILSWWDPSFHPASTPFWVYFCCASIHVAVFTCAGIDAAGRLFRRESSDESTVNPIINPYCSVEYVDRVLESLSLSTKVVCLLHVVGVGNGNLSYFCSFLLLFVVLGCFLCQQWESCITKVYHTSGFLDSCELALLGAYTARVVVGQACSWSSLGTVYLFNTPVTQIFCISFYGGAAVSLLNCSYNMKHVSTTDSRGSPFIPYFALLICQIYWITLADIPAIFPYLCWSSGIVFSALTTELILNNISTAGSRSSSCFAIGILAMLALGNALHVFPHFVATENVWLTVCSVLSVWLATMAAVAATDVVHRVLLAMTESFFRHAGQALAPYWNRMKKDSRSRF